MYNYIPHPSNCRVSSELLALLANEGPSGYGIYWMLLEMLRDAPEYKLEFNEKLLSFSLHLTDAEVLKRVVQQYNLFTIDKNGRFSSPWLCGAMEEYDSRKKKLQEAGRRGAHNRWGGASNENSKPIATLSDFDSEPLPPDTIPYNVTQQDFTLPDTSGGDKVGPEFLEMMCQTQPEGHAPAYVAQVCMQYGMTEATHSFICEHSNNAKVDHPTFRKFVAIVKRIQAENWVPKHPDAFFIKKLFA